MSAATASSSDSSVSAADAYALALASPATGAVFDKWRHRLAEAKQLETALLARISDASLSADARAQARVELDANAINVVRFIFISHFLMRFVRSTPCARRYVYQTFCAEQVQWYALHLARAASGDADPNIDNRAW
jgi:hypothetical protein